MAITLVSDHRRGAVANPTSGNEPTERLFRRWPSNLRLPGWPRAKQGTLATPADDSTRLDSAAAFSTGAAAAAP